MGRLACARPWPCDGGLRQQLELQQPAARRHLLACVPPDTTVGAPGSVEPCHVTRPLSSAVNSRGWDDTSNRPGPRHTTVCEQPNDGAAPVHTVSHGMPHLMHTDSHSNTGDHKPHHPHHTRTTTSCAGVPKKSVTTTPRRRRRRDWECQSLDASKGTCSFYLPPHPDPQQLPGGHGRRVAPREW